MDGRSRCGLVKLAGVPFFAVVLFLLSTAHAHFTFFPILLLFYSGSDLNTVIGAAVSTMLGRAADDLLPSGAETPQGWLHHDLNKEVIHANTSSTAKLAGGAAKAHAASGAHGAHPTSSAAAAAVAGTTISTVAAAAPGHASDLEYEPPAELVRLLSDRLTVELFALRNQVR